MTLTFAPSTDFEDVVDGLQAVTLVRRGKAATSIASALQRAIGEREAAASNGQYTSRDVRWHLPEAEVGDRPDVGDAIVDASGNRYTILETNHTTLGNRWVCIARDLVVFWRLTDWFTIEEATFSKGTGGAAEASWTRLRVVRGRMQPIGRAMTVEEEARRTTRRWQLFVEEDLGLTHEHRIKAADGTRYAIESVTGPEQIGQVPVIEVSEWRQG